MQHFFLSPRLLFLIALDDLVHNMDIVDETPMLEAIQSITDAFLQETSSSKRATLAAMYVPCGSARTNARFLFLARSEVIRQCCAHDDFAATIGLLCHDDTFLYSPQRSTLKSRSLRSSSTSIVAEE